MDSSFGIDDNTNGPLNYTKPLPEIPLYMYLKLHPFAIDRLFSIRCLESPAISNNVVYVKISRQQFSVVVLFSLVIPLMKSKEKSYFYQMRWLPHGTHRRSSIQVQDLS